VTIDKPAALRELADRFKDQIGSGIVVLGCETGGKALLIVVVTKDLGKRFHAGEIIKQIAPSSVAEAAVDRIWPKQGEHNLNN
jgi:alanyl-tRNA synthetase